MTKTPMKVFVKHLYDFLETFLPVRYDTVYRAPASYGLSHYACFDILSVLVDDLHTSYCTKGLLLLISGRIFDLCYPLKHLNRSSYAVSCFVHSFLCHW